MKWYNIVFWVFKFVFAFVVGFLEAVFVNFPKNIKKRMGKKPKAFIEVKEPSEPSEGPAF